MIPKRSEQLINVFEAHSESLGADVLNILTKVCTLENNREGVGHDVTVERIKDLDTYIALSHETKYLPHFHAFVNQGFKELSNELNWANIEQELYLLEREKVHTRRGGSILSALTHLAKVFFDDQKLSSPSRAVIGDKAIDLSLMYLYPVKWVVDFKKLTEKILQLPNGHSKYSGGISLMLKAFAEVRNTSGIVRYTLDKTVSEAINDDNIFEVLLSKIPKQNQSRLKKIRSVHNPKLHGPEKKFARKTNHNLNAGLETRGAHWIYELSPKWFEQCQSYVSDVYKNHGQKAATSSITRLTKLSSAIFDYYADSLDSLEQLRSDGISAFFDNDQTLIRRLYNSEDSRIRSCIGEICFMHNHIHSSDWKLTDLIDLVVMVDCDSGDDNYRSIILDQVAAKYPAIAQAIYDYAQYELKRIDGDQRSKETVFGQISMVKAIFTSHLDLLNSDDHLRLAELGLAALETNNCRIIKRIRSALADKLKNDELSLGSARGMQSAFGLFCAHYKLTDVHSYAVSGKKRKVNDYTKKAADYYSKEEVAAIAYSIEVGLMDNTVSQKEELLLRLGRILLKTGWNLSPLLMLEIDDILKLDAPVTGKTAHFIRLFKKRAGYKTQFYEFALNDDRIRDEGLVFGTEVTNALADIEYIRDNISSQLRQHLTDASKLNYRLSLYRDEKGKIRSPSYVKFSAQLCEILRRYECEIPFNVQKIRKGGLNYIYKTYAKNVKDYKKAGQHSLKTFLEVYLRNDGIKSEETIASASTTMSDYFSGRPISEEIIIVTEIPLDTKQTPSGRCASNGNDAESEAFNKQQQRLNRSSETESSQCGDFNACLFCKHFRVVADAEHVWRLLSYHRYVVGEMERGVSDYDNTTDQSNYVDVLNRRVETILAELSEINSDAVLTGRRLLDTKGCHEDWKFFADIGVAR